MISLLLYRELSRAGSIYILFLSHHLLESRLAGNILVDGCLIFLIGYRKEFRQIVATILYVLNKIN